MAGAQDGGGVLTDADFLKKWRDTVPRSAFRNRRDIIGVVVIPARFRKIEESAFDGCSGLTELRLPDTLTKIGDGAFYGCSGLTELRLPDTLAEIGVEAFAGCSGLTELRLPDTVTDIGKSAFCGCSALEQLLLPGSIECLGPHVFRKCTSLRLVAMHSAIEFGSTEDDDDSVEGYDDDDDEGMRCGQFEGCASLMAVSAPAEVASRFSADMFAGCGTVPSALLAATTADLALWYYWSRQTHLRCSPAAKDTVLAVMLVGLRLDRDSSRRRSNRRPRLPALPSEIWCCVLERVCRHQLVVAL